MLLADVVIKTDIAIEQYRSHKIDMENCRWNVSFLAEKKAT